MLKAMAVGSVVRRISRIAAESSGPGAEVESGAGDGHERAGRYPDRAPAGEARGRHGRRQRPDPHPHGERARAAHPRGDRPSRRGRGQAPAAAAHPRGGPALRLRRASDHVKLAATVEFIHTATLLHDDVVDESARRRGRPTANLLWDNKSSVLVGDYLFARSFQLMTETGSLRVLDILANASAVIAEGEVLQLTAASDLATDEATYLQVIRGKTAALFAAATEVGGVIAGAAEAEVRALLDYGDALGIAFQIADDLLDYGGRGATLGKNVGDDFRERKMTLPVIRALAAARRRGAGFWARTVGRGGRGGRSRPGAGDPPRAAARWPRPTTPPSPTPTAPGRRSRRCRRAAPRRPRRHRGVRGRPRPPDPDRYLG